MYAVYGQPESALLRSWGTLKPPQSLGLTCQQACKGFLGCPTEFKYRHILCIVAIVITVCNNIPALCIYSNDGGNYGFVKRQMIICLNDDTYIQYGSQNVLAALPVTEQG